MRVRAAKWGNSVAVRLPKRALDALGLKPGEELEMTVAEGKVELSPARPRISLDWIVSEMARLGPEAAPETVDWGPDRGVEGEFDRDRS